MRACAKVEVIRIKKSKLRITVSFIYPSGTCVIIVKHQREKGVWKKDLMSVPTLWYTFKLNMLLNPRPLCICKITQADISCESAAMHTQGQFYLVIPV